MANKKINEYEAAVEFGLSPELLRWLTQNHVVDKKKLPFIEDGVMYYYELTDLQDLDKKMAGKWPLPSKGNRPSIPEGIKREIKTEAQFSCPVCHRQQGELAHIRPVSKTYCNHPDNLIYLCPNHHTEYDYGHIYQNVSYEDVKAFKESLKRFNKIQWSLKGKLIQTYLGLLNTTKSLLEVYELVKDIIDNQEFKDILNSVLQSISKQKRKNVTALTAEVIDEEINNYTTSNAKDLCPLCNGLGSTFFYQPCPICLGNGEVQDSSRLERLAEYDLVDCSLCDGTGKKDYDECPACHGKCKVPKGWADNHDWSQYNLVDCYLCDGTGKKDYDECPACHGGCKVLKGWADNHDWPQYDLVDCSLCDGTGKKDYDECPACHGECKIPKGLADNHDWSRYDE